MSIACPCTFIPSVHKPLRFTWPLWMFILFDLVNSLVKYDIKSLTKILQEINNIDVDVFGLLKLLITNFRRVIDIQLSRNPSAQALGMTDKQFWAIKK